MDELKDWVDSLKKEFENAASEIVELQFSSKNVKSEIRKLELMNRMAALSIMFMALGINNDQGGEDE